MIGEFKNRITTQSYGAPSQTATGGLIPGTPGIPVTRWAKVENRTGSLSYGKGREWNYDYKITIRHLPGSPVNSGDLVTYEGNRLVIREVQNIDEGRNRYIILRCSRHE